MAHSQVTASFRPCRSGYKVGPLLADDLEIAEYLFLALQKDISVNAPVFLDTPAVNAAATDLTKRHNMTPIFETARMGSKRLHTWFHVILPASLPFHRQRHETRPGFRVALADGGRDLRDNFDWLWARPFAALRSRINAMDQVIGVMFIIVVIGLLADKILFSPWERFLHRRWGTGRA